MVSAAEAKEPELPDHAAYPEPRRLPPYRIRGVPRDLCPEKGRSWGQS